MIKISTYCQYEEVVNVLNGLIKKPTFVNINGVEIPEVEKFDILQTDDLEVHLFLKHVSVRISGKIIQISTLRSDADIIFINLVEDDGLMVKREQYLDSLCKDDSYFEKQADLNNTY